jgi:hypothetical protein
MALLVALVLLVALTLVLLVALTLALLVALTLMLLVAFVLSPGVAGREATCGRPPSPGSEGTETPSRRGRPPAKLAPEPAGCEAVALTLAPAETDARLELLAALFPSFGCEPADPRLPGRVDTFPLAWPIPVVEVAILSRAGRPPANGELSVERGLLALEALPAALELSVRGGDNAAGSELGPRGALTVAS